MPSESAQFLDVENGRDLKNGGHIAEKRAEFLLIASFP
jgi:hypothetical protein